MTLLPWDLRPSHNSTTSTNNCWRTPPLKTDELLAVRNPDVLHLRRLTKKIAPLSLAHVGPRARLPLGPRSLHVPRRRQLHRPDAVARPEVPHRIHVVVLGESLRERVLRASHDIDHARRHVRRLQ